MMKAPATVTDIAEASGVGADEVADFINANLATGYAELATAVEATRPGPGGLFGRIRSR
jgi:ActR/RegA family two-component response regulator